MSTDQFLVMRRMRMMTLLILGYFAPGFFVGAIVLLILYMIWKRLEDFNRIKRIKREKAVLSRLLASTEKRKRKWANK